MQMSDRVGLLCWTSPLDFSGV